MLCSPIPLLFIGAVSGLFWVEEHLLHTAAFSFRWLHDSQTLNCWVEGMNILKILDTWKPSVFRNWLFFLFVLCRNGVGATTSWGVNLPLLMAPGQVLLVWKPPQRWRVNVNEVKRLKSKVDFNCRAAQDWKSTKNSHWFWRVWVHVWGQRFIWGQSQ